MIPGRIRGAGGIARRHREFVGHLRNGARHADAPPASMGRCGVIAGGRRINDGKGTNACNSE